REHQSLEMTGQVTFPRAITVLSSRSELPSQGPSHPSSPCWSLLSSTFSFCEWNEGK
ncbi:hypothetical protein STEG23_036559, partial [Scotinomys teguina]